MYWCYIIWSGCNPFPGVNASPSAPQCSRHCLCQASPFQCWPRQVSVLLYMPGNATLTFQYASSVNSLTDTEVLIVIFFSLFSFDITHTGGKFALTGNTVSQRQCDNNVTCHRGEGLGSGNVLALSGFSTIDCCYIQATEMLFTLFTKRKPLTLSASWIGCCQQFIDGRRGCNLQFSKIIGVLSLANKKVYIFVLARPERQKGCPRFEKMDSRCHCQFSLALRFTFPGTREDWKMSIKYI